MRVFCLQVLHQHAGAMQQAPARLSHLPSMTVTSSGSPHDGLPSGASPGRLSSRPGGDQSKPGVERSIGSLGHSRRNPASPRLWSASRDGAEGGQSSGWRSAVDAAPIQASMHSRAPGKRHPPDRRLAPCAQWSAEAAPQAWLAESSPLSLKRQTLHHCSGLPPRFGKTGQHLAQMARPLPSAALAPNLNFQPGRRRPGPLNKADV